jgi:hypothetical protein
LPEFMQRPAVYDGAAQTHHVATANVRFSADPNVRSWRISVSSLPSWDQVRIRPAGGRSQVHKLGLRFARSRRRDPGRFLSHHPDVVGRSHMRPSARVHGNADTPPDRRPSGALPQE